VIIHVVLVKLNKKGLFQLLTLDVITDDQMEATFAETSNLPVIKRAYSLKAAKQPKDTSKVCCVYVVSSSVTN